MSTIFPRTRIRRQAASTHGLNSVTMIKLLNKHEVYVRQSIKPPHVNGASSLLPRCSLCLMVRGRGAAVSNRRTRRDLPNLQTELLFWVSSLSCHAETLFEGDALSTVSIQYLLPYVPYCKETQGGPTPDRILLYRYCTVYGITVLYSFAAKRESTCGRESRPITPTSSYYQSSSCSRKLYVMANGNA